MRDNAMRPCAILILAAATLFAGCGEETEEVDLTCSGGQPIRLSGEVGEVDGNFLRNVDAGNLQVTVPIGELNDKRITLDLGEVDFLVAGAEEPEQRPRILVFQTNIADPEGSNLLENLNRRINSGEEGANELRVVDKDAEAYCDVEAGEICVRFGLDETGNRELAGDNVIHVGVGGTVKINALSATQVALEWDIDFGPNISKFGDMGSGNLEGCFAGQRGNPMAGLEPIEVPGS